MTDGRGDKDVKSSSRRVKRVDTDAGTNTWKCPGSNQDDSGSRERHGRKLEGVISTVDEIPDLSPPDVRVDDLTVSLGEPQTACIHRDVKGRIVAGGERDGVMGNRLRFVGGATPSNECREKAGAH
jgi:hypothetical protein